MKIGSSHIPYKCFLKTVFTISRRPYERKVRLFRAVWSRLGGPGAHNKRGYSAKLSFNLVPRAFQWKRERSDLRVAILGVQVHYQRHYGGWIC